MHIERGSMRWSLSLSIGVLTGTPAAASVYVVLDLDLITLIEPARGA